MGWINCHHIVTIVIYPFIDTIRCAFCVIFVIFVCQQSGSRVVFCILISIFIPHSHFVNASFQVCIHSAFSFIPSEKQANAFFAWLLSACLLDSVFVAASLCLMPVILSSLCACADPHLLFSFTSSFPFLYPFHSHSSNCPLPALPPRS